MQQKRSGGNFEPTRGQKWALEALLGGFRAPGPTQKEAQMAPERVPNGASEEGKDDPEAEGLKKEGTKSSKNGYHPKQGFKRVREAHF